MRELYTGLLWLLKSNEKRDEEYAKAVEYTEAKCGRRVMMIACTPAEMVSEQWQDIPVRADKHVQPRHIFLITSIDRETPAPI